MNYFVLKNENYDGVRYLFYSSPREVIRALKASAGDAFVKNRYRLFAGIPGDGDRCNLLAEKDYDHKNFRWA